MADQTPQLGLPYLATNQAQKEITHNEALDIIDFFIQPVVQSRINTPPGSPVEGNAYIITASPSGAWAGNADKIARYMNSTWTFYSPFPGLGVWSIADAKDYIYHNSAWMQRPQEVKDCDPKKTSDS